MSDNIRKFSKIIRGLPETPTAPAWKQGENLVKESTRERYRDVARPAGSYEETVRGALKKPITRLGRNDYGEVASFLQNLVNSGDRNKVSLARQAYAKLSQAERQAVDALIVQAMPNPRENAGLSEGAGQLLRVLNGADLSPERQRAIADVARFEGFPGEGLEKPDAPITRAAPPDRLPETAETSRIESPKGLNEKVGNASIETRPAFRGPKAEITVAPAMDTDTRLKATQRLVAARNNAREELIRTIEGIDVAGRGSALRKAIAISSPDLTPKEVAARADEELIRINQLDRKGVLAYARNMIPDLSPEQLDSEVSRLWQKRNDLEYTRKVSSNQSEWAIPYWDKSRLDAAEKMDRGEPLTAAERKLLSTPVGMPSANRSSMDVGEESKHQQFVGNLVRVLGRRPGFSPPEYQAGRDWGRPKNVPDNVQTMLPGDAEATPRNTPSDEFDPEEIVEGSITPSEVSRRLKPRSAKKGGTRSDELSSDALDHLFARLVVDVQGGKNVAAAKPPAAYGFKTPEDVARQIVRIANLGGEPVIPPSMIDGVVAELAQKIERRWGSDVGASKIKAKKPTPDNAITEQAAETRLPGAFDAAVDRFRRMRAGETVEPRAAAQEPAARQPYVPPVREGTSQNPDFLPVEKSGSGMNKAGEPYPPMTPEEYARKREEYERIVQRKGYEDASIPVAIPPVKPRSEFDPRPVNEPTGEPFDPEARNERLAQETADFESDPLLGIFDDEPQATPSVVRPAPTQVGAPDAEVVDSSATVDDINARLNEAVNANDPAAPQPEKQKMTAGEVLKAANATGKRQGRPFIDKRLMAEVKRSVGLIANSPSGKQLDGAMSFHERALQRRSRVPVDLLPEYDEKVMKPLEEAIAARQAKFPQNPAQPATGQGPTKQVAPQQQAAVEAPAPSRPESIDPLESANPAEITPPVTAEAAATSPGDTLARAMTGKGPEGAALRGLLRGLRRRVLQPSTLLGDAANAQRAVREVLAPVPPGSATAAVPTVPPVPPRSGAAGVPPESATPAAAETAARSADNVDAAKATKDAESDKAVAVAKQAEAQTDDAAVSKRAEDAANAGTAPQRGASTVGSVAKRAAYYATNPGVAVTDAIVGAAAAGLKGGWAGSKYIARNLPGLGLLGAGAYYTRDQWMPHVPKEAREFLENAVGAGEELLNQAGEAVQGFGRRHADPQPGIGMDGPEGQPVMDVGGVLPGMPGGQAPVGRPVMVDEDPSTDRIRRMLNIQKQISPYEPQTPMRPTTYFY